MILNQSPNVYMGANPVQSIYLGATKIWPSGTSGGIWSFTQIPSTITGFKVTYLSGNATVNWGDFTTSSLSSNVSVSHSYS